ERVERGQARGKVAAGLEVERCEQLEDDAGCTIQAGCLAFDVTRVDLCRGAAQVRAQVLVEQRDELLAAAAHDLRFEVRRSVPLTGHRDAAPRQRTLCAPSCAICPASHWDCACACASICSNATNRSINCSRCRSRRSSNRATRSWSCRTDAPIRSRTDGTAPVPESSNCFAMSETAAPTPRLNVTVPTAPVALPV